MSIQFTDNPAEANAITHAGKAHLDELLCIIVLEIIFKILVVFRCPSPSYDDLKPSFRDDAIIFDIGYGPFDHHQENGNGFHPVSENYSHLKPIPYASFGLIWRMFGEKVCDILAGSNTELSKYLWNKVEQELCLVVDSADNGIFHIDSEKHEFYPVLTISQAISMTNLNYQESTEEEVCLRNGLLIAKIAFNNLIQRAIYEFNNPTATKSDYTNPYASKLEVHEIFSTAVLQTIFSDYHNFDITQYKTDIDYAYHPFKHFSSYGIKEEIPTSSLGVIWYRYGRNYCSRFFQDSDDIEFLWRYINNEIIYSIDAYSHQIYPTTNNEYVPYNLILFPQIVEDLITSPSITSDEIRQKAEKVAFKLATMLFYRVLKRGISLLQAKEVVEKRIETSRQNILLLNESLPWEKWLFKSRSLKAKQIYFIVLPSKQGGYNVLPVRERFINDSSFRVGFPKTWYGKNGAELCELTGIKTATFIHDKGFLAGTTTERDAIKLAKKAINIAKSAGMI